MFRVFGLFALCAIALGCSQVQLNHQSDSFNRASANSIGEHTLLNAVRSSLDMSMSFTKLVRYTAGSMANGGFNAKLPFGAKAQPIFDLGPTLNWSGGVTAIEYGDANNSGALASLNKNIGYDAIDRYVYQGISSRILRTIFVTYLEAHTELWAAIVDQHRRECASPTNEQNTYACAELQRINTLCRAEWKGALQETFTLVGGDQVIGINNYAGSRCEFLKYQVFENLIRLSGFWSEYVPETADEKKATDGKSIGKEPGRQGIGFEVQAVQRVYERLEAKFEGAARKKKEPRRQALRFIQRSPKGLLAYLGDLIALQNRSQAAFVPELMLRSGKKVTLFRVIRGAPSSQPIALTVVGPDDQTYSIPQPDYGVENRDQTLRVLSIAAEVVNAAISDKDIPPPAGVVVRNF